MKGLLPTLEDWARSIWSILRGTVIGFFLGILPGGGAVIASFVSYAVEKRVSKHPEQFGKGAIEGVAAPESANNAAAQGAFIPLMTMGIPANAVMALLLGALSDPWGDAGAAPPHRASRPLLGGGGQHVYR